MSRSSKGTAAAAARALPVLAALASLTACVTPHNSLGTKSSSCFQGLPAATAAVHKKGKLVGVRAVSGSTARDVLAGQDPSSATTTTSAPSTTAAPGPGAAPDEPAGRGVCLFAFKSSYRAADVDHLRPESPPSGQYAVVAVTIRSVRPVGTVLTDKLPVRFHHLR